MWQGWFLKPPRPVAHNLQVLCLIHETMEGLDRLPDRQVNDHLRVVIPPEVGGVAVLGLETPNEARARLSESIDSVQLRNKTGDLRIVERRNQSSDIELCQLAGSHFYMVAAI